MFFAEALCSYLRSHVPHIDGLQLPPIANTDQELLDKEYADDIALYTAFSVENMDRQKSALEVLCTATMAHINWHKSCRFLVGTAVICTWGEEMGFTWIPHGHTCPHYVSHVQHHGTLVPGRALCVSLLIDGRSIGFLSIYAPTEACARSHFWESLLQSLPCMDFGLLEEISIMLSCLQMSALRVHLESPPLLPANERIAIVLCWSFLGRMHGTYLLSLIYRTHSPSHKFPQTGWSSPREN